MINSVVSFLAVFVFLHPVFCTDDNDKAMLSQMQDWGGKIFKLIQIENKTNKTEGQYLVAALLPDAVLNKPNELSKRLLKGCPTKPDIGGKMIECSTSAVILNKVSEDIWNNSPWNNDERYRKHAWHGEYMLLNEGIIERLIDNFHRENENDAQCRVYLYSFFIPCADILGCPYSCSDQVAEYNNRAGITCKVTVIGYTKVFRRSNTMKTNEVRATDVLKAEMDLYHTVSDVKLKAIKTVREKYQAVSFQELMYTCLYESPLSGCCVDYKDDRVNSELVIAYFVNSIVYRAVNNQTFKNKRFSNKTRDKLRHYFLDLFQKQVHTDCTLCPYDRYNTFLIDFCSKTALDLASGFGSPTIQNDLSSAKWNAPRSDWKNLYRISPAEFLNTKKIMCAYRPLSIDSLCTRLPVTSINLPVLRKRHPSLSESDED